MIMINVFRNRYLLDKFDELINEYLEKYFSALVAIFLQIVINGKP